MKEKIKKVLKKYRGEILIIIGTALSSYNIFNFSYGYELGCVRKYVYGSTVCNTGLGYFYKDISLILISFGLVLIVLGILIIRNKR